jgi:phosphorylcholine metabolism protein LicD
MMVRLLHVLFLFDDWSKSVELRYWLDYGTLLGAVRNGTVIPWDWDVDIGVMKEEIEAVPQLGVRLKSGGLSFSRKTSCRLDICLIENSQACIDVFMYIIRKSDNFAIRCEVDDVFRYQFPASFVNPTKPIMFEGHMLPGPNNPEKFLKQYRYPYSYGWEVPTKIGCFFNDWRKYAWPLASVCLIALMLIFAVLYLCCKL